MALNGSGPAESPTIGGEYGADSIRPRISVVIPTHNRPELLYKALESVRRQTFGDWEIVVVDDQSKPPVNASNPRVCQPESRGRVRAFRTDESLGCSGSKARGALVAQGDYVTFLDDDDLFHPDLLQRVVEIMDGDPAVETLFLGVDWFGEGAPIERAQHTRGMERILSGATNSRSPSGARAFGRDLIEHLVDGIPMPFQRPVYRQATLQRIGVHRQLPCLGDCDMALRAAIGSRCALIDEGLYQQRCENQGFFSRPERSLAQLTSHRDIMHHLLGRAVADDADPLVVRALGKGASGGSYSLAYALSRQGDIQGTVASWWQGMRVRPSARACRLPIAALLRRFGFRKG